MARRVLITEFMHEANTLGVRFADGRASALMPSRTDASAEPQQPACGNRRRPIFPLDDI